MEAQRVPYSDHVRTHTPSFSRSVCSSGDHHASIPTLPFSVPPSPSSLLVLIILHSGFFHNKGAVAGVFTVVGLIALAIGIALVTNAVRRRRAKKFDREIDAAAEEARKAGANTDFFDGDDYNPAGYDNFSSSLGRSRSVYTDGTHGTYSQQPLRAVESYGMTELHTGDPYTAAGVGAAGAGAAAMADSAGNAGVGAAGLNRSRSTTAPYNAFAGPGAYPRPAPSTAPADPFYGAPPMPAGYPAAYSPPQNAQASLFEAAGLGDVTLDTDIHVHNT